MTTTTEKQAAKPKQTPDFYIFESANGEKGSKPGRSSLRPQKELRLHTADRRQAVRGIPAQGENGRTAAQPEQSAQGEGA